MTIFDQEYIQQLELGGGYAQTGYDHTAEHYGVVFADGRPNLQRKNVPDTKREELQLKTTC